MSEGFICRRGGSGESKGATKKTGGIGVTYPAGSECSVSNGIKTYKALNTSGSAAFIVEPGEWEVTTSLGEDKVSERVSVEAGGWVSVELIYRRYLFEEGRGQVEAMTSGSDINGSCEITASSIVFSKTNDYSGNAWALTNAPVDVSKFATLCCEATCTEQYSGIQPETWLRAIGLYADAGDGASNSASAYTYFDANSSRTLYSADISQMSGEFYVGSKGIGAAVIHNIWLE